MIKEFLESLKIKDIVFFVLIIVLFMIVLKKNKKEGFTDPYVYTASDFKTKVETALGDNLTAIQNLGDFAGQLITANNKLDLSGVELKVKSLEVKNNSTIKGNLSVEGETALNGPSTVKSIDLTKFDGRIKEALNKAKAALPKTGGTLSGGLNIKGPVEINNSNNKKPALTVNHSCSDPLYLNCNGSNCWIRYNQNHTNTCAVSNSSDQHGKTGAWAGIYGGKYKTGTY